MLRQIPYHVHVGLQVEVHVNCLIKRDLSSLSCFNLLTGRACTIICTNLLLFANTVYIVQRPFLKGLWRG